MRDINIKKRFVESSFLKVFNIIKKNPNTYLYTMLLDFIFIALIISVGKYLGSFIPQDPEQIMTLFKTQTNLLLFVLTYPILYYLFVIFVYSITKLSILNMIDQLYEKKKFSLNGLGKFYLLNILLFIIFFFSALAVLGLLALILEKDFLKYVFLIFLIPSIFFTYSITNISHTFFIRNQRNKIIKKSFSITFDRIKKYGMFIVWDIILTLIYLLLYNIIHLIFRFVVFSNQELLAAYGSMYLKTFSIISIIFTYLIIAFNRIYFYERINKNVLQ